MNRFNSTFESIESLLNNPKIQFDIPAYQRPYVWGDEEINKFLEDIYNAYLAKQDNYFIGNVYVNKTESGIFSIVDGQQRFTTLWLIAVVFNDFQEKNQTQLTTFLGTDKVLRLKFSIRDQVEHYLKSLLNGKLSIYNEDQIKKDDFLKHIARGLTTIRGILQDIENLSSFGDYIFSNVKFVFNEAPNNTDLNNLFTTLGSSGIQLEQTDILKSMLLRNIDNKDNKDNKVMYSKIWEACENMDDYFENNVKEVFGESKNSFFELGRLSKFDRELYNNVIENIDDNIVNESTISSMIETFNQLENNVGIREVKRDKSVSLKKCESIINFSLLLLHTYRIFRFIIINKQDDFSQPFDKKNLLLIFKDLVENEDPNEDPKVLIPQFFELLWKVRYFFDNYIVKKRNKIDDESEEDEIEGLTLTKLIKDGNSIKRTIESHSSFSQLQSVLYFTGGYNQQYWLTPFLGFLIQHENPIDRETALLELEKIDNFLLPGDKKDISWSLLQTSNRSKKDENIIDNIVTPNGTSFNHYWFYKLEYLLWKTWDNNDNKFKKFRITSKNSIEHVFPQNHEFGEELEQDENGYDRLHSFGNLGLLSVGQNSEYSNYSITRKLEIFNHRQTYDSLKLAKIYSSPSINSWGVKEIEEHQKEMFDLIEKHYSA